MSQIDTEKENLLVEDELWAALVRLKNKVFKGRAVRISYSAVAAEAGRSRTLIGHEDCAYPAVRQAIREAIDAQGGRRTSKAGPASKQPGDLSALNTATNEPDPADPYRLVEHLKHQVVHLTNRNKVAAIKIVTIDDENQQLREEIKRLKAELTRRRTI